MLNTRIGNTRILIGIKYLIYNVLYMELIFVGIYTIILYLYLRTNNLFIIGFMKHLLGYFLFIHRYYCRKKCNLESALFRPVILQSIIEGIYYYFLYKLLYRYINNKLKLFFIIGFITHILAEYVGIHILFCRINCYTSSL